MRARRGERRREETWACQEEHHRWVHRAERRPRFDCGASLRGDAIGASSYFAGATLSSTKDDHPDQASGDMAYASRDSGSQEMAVSFGRGPFGSSPLAQPLRHLTRPLRCLTEARRTI